MGCVPWTDTSALGSRAQPDAVPSVRQWGRAGMLDLLPVQHSHVPGGHVCAEARKGGKEKKKKELFLGLLFCEFSASEKCWIDSSGDGSVLHSAGMGSPAHCPAGSVLWGGC